MFSFLTDYPTKAKEPNLPYYLPIAKGRTDGFIPSSRTFVQKGMQTAWSRAWSQIPNSISFGDNCYSTPLSKFQYVQSLSSFVDHIRKQKLLVHETDLKYLGYHLTGSKNNWLIDKSLYAMTVMLIMYPCIDFKLFLIRLKFRKVSLKSSLKWQSLCCTEEQMKFLVGWLKFYDIPTLMGYLIL